METQFNINKLYEELGEELNNWYNEQPFAVLNRIHATNLFDYPEYELQYILDEFWHEWNELATEERIDLYNQYKDLKFR